MPEPGASQSVVAHATVLASPRRPSIVVETNTPAPPAPGCSPAWGTGSGGVDAQVAFATREANT